MKRSFSVSSRHWLTGVTLGVSVVLTGCAPVLVGGAAVTGASIASDPRTAGQQLEDKEIELKASNIVQTQFHDLARINTSAMNGVVLLTGDAVDTEVRDRAVRLIGAIPNVKSVIDRIVIGPRLSFTQVTSDTWLSSKIYTTLLATRGIPSNSVKATVENGNVYLQGMVTQEQATDIAKTVSSISGVKEVFTMFDIRSADELNRPIGTSVSSDTSFNAAPSMSQTDGATSVSPVIAPSTPEARPL